MSPELALPVTPPTAVTTLPLLLLVAVDGEVMLLPLALDVLPLVEPWRAAFVLDPPLLPPPLPAPPLAPPTATPAATDAAKPLAELPVRASPPVESPLAVRLPLALPPLTSAGPAPPVDWFAVVRPPSAAWKAVLPPGAPVSPVEPLVPPPPVAAPPLPPAPPA